MDCFLSHWSLMTPIGMLQINCCDKGVHSINRHNADYDSQGNKLELKTEFNPNSLEDCETSMLSDTACWLEKYFQANIMELENTPPICPKVFASKGNFTEKVWQTLYMIPVGKTITYKGLAELSGNARAARAVGTAMKNNPVPIIIPCHRVIKSDGCIGHYTGGRDYKEWLLRHEKAIQ